MLSHISKPSFVKNIVNFLSYSATHTHTDIDTDEKRK